MKVTSVTIMTPRISTSKLLIWSKNFGNRSSYAVAPFCSTKSSITTQISPMMIIRSMSRVS